MRVLSQYRRGEYVRAMLKEDVIKEIKNKAELYNVQLSDEDLETLVKSVTISDEYVERSNKEWSRLVGKSIRELLEKIE
jgi:2-phospho-L-lactate guanylyltransferase (CobY/MobA/RfbA family)